MSIHDVDKNPGRLEPSPNTHDNQEGVRPAHGTNSLNYHTDASTTATGILMGMLRPVATGTFRVILDGSTLSTATLAHGLGYKPFMLCAVENSTATIAGGTATGVSLFTPTYLGADLSHAGDIQFGLWLETFCNDTNIYANVLNTDSIAGGVTVTYYLFQQSPA